MPKPKTNDKAMRKLNILSRVIKYQGDGNIALNFRKFQKGKMINDRTVQDLLFYPGGFKEYNGDV
eukprot:CAMPEP_0194117172 /NCGR_PEP_ID=MMETSP0150-20130528/30265_1 /TAXON_ID=122233 /ORGANISM="Chaetoceros debilis, Strain MM31A-1" /LENGTH=64 /DNA_ID=CAMNT_0038808097 /DNA_START=19 /DNA_END=209 /DNA_ORIENTATION=+